MEGLAEEPVDARTRVHIELAHDYQARVLFDGGMHELTMDEPPPLGDGSGPNASSVLGAAVGHCLTASLLFCLRKARADVEGIDADVDVTVTRNDRGRLRVGAIRVELHPRLAPGAEGGVRRCLELFEDFCVVTEAVRDGIDVDVAVSPRTSAPSEGTPAPLEGAGGLGPTSSTTGGS